MFMKLKSFCERANILVFSIPEIKKNAPDVEALFNLLIFFLKQIRHKNGEYQNGETQCQNGDGFAIHAFPFLQQDAPDIA